MTTFEDLHSSRIVTLRGEVDAFTAPALRLDLEQLIESAIVSTFVIDLAGVTFLDSSALGAFVGALRLLRERGATLRVVEPQGAAGRIFAHTGLDEVLDLYPTRELALKSGESD